MHIHHIDRKNIVAGILTLFLSVLISAVILHGDITILYLFSGLLVGVFLFMRPDISLWVTIISALCVSGTIVYFAPELKNLRWGIVLISLVLGARSLLELVVPSSNQRRGGILNGITFFLLGFFTIALLGLVINRVPSVQLIVSIKNYFQFLPIFLALILLPLNSNICRRLLWVLLGVALIQVPVSLLQQLFVVPYKVHLTGTIGPVLGDAIVGTFGGSMFAGGASSFLGLFLIYAIGCTLSLAFYGQITWKRSFIISICFFSPLLFNETKIVFIFIAILMVTIFKRDIFKNPSIGITLILLTITMFIAMVFAYDYLYVQYAGGWQKYLNTAVEYNFGRMGYGGFILNRTTALVFWFQHQDISRPLNFLFGYGLGAAAEGAGIGPLGHVAARYPGFGIGFTMVTRLLWDVGVLGFLFYMGSLISAFHLALKMEKSPRLEPIEKAIALSLQLGIALFFINTLYRLDYLYFQSANATQMLFLGWIVLLLKIESERGQVHSQ